MKDSSKQLSKKTWLYLGGFLFLCVYMIWDGVSSSQSREKEMKTEMKSQISKWGQEDFERIYSEFRGSEFEKFQVFRLAQKIQYDESPKTVLEFIKSGKVKEMIKDSVLRDSFDFEYNIDNIAGKNEEETEQILGNSELKESVNPSRTPCPCPKNTYLGGTVEIVFIKGKADWITINLSKYHKNIVSKNFFIKRFDDYAYIKAFTE